MTRIKELKQHFEAMEDMKEIVTALKTLAFMETKKLSRYLADQGRAVQSIREAASDFLCFYPLLLPQAKPGKTLLVAVGADRGFCGNFNELIVGAVASELERVGKENLQVIAVGDRLCTKLGQTLTPQAAISGATFAEEAPAVLAKAVELVGELIEGNQPEITNITIVAHQWGTEAVTVIDPLRGIKAGTHYGSAPRLNLEPGLFFQLLMDQYLQLVFYNIFYNSLMAENTKRIMHLDLALKRLEEDATNLKRQYNQARQEEITEEIEILIMNSPATGKLAQSD